MRQGELFKEIGARFGGIMLMAVSALTIGAWIDSLDGKDSMFSGGDWPEGSSILLGLLSLQFALPALVFFGPMLVIHGPKGP